MPDFTEVNQWGQAVVDRIDQYSGNFLAQNGRYPEVLQTHTQANIPALGNATAPDNIDAGKSDVPERWADTGWQDLGDVWLATFRIDAYLSPQGHGYRIVAYVLDGADLYRRSIVRGPVGAGEPWTPVAAGDFA